MKIDAAEKIIETVVDMIAEKRYNEIDSIAELTTLTMEDVKELVEDYMKLNELTHIDKFSVICDYHPHNQYKQLNIYYFDDGSGFSVDYDLTTNGELNDLTLQMEFINDEESGFKARLLDLHVL